MNTKKGIIVLKTALPLIGSNKVYNVNLYYLIKARLGQSWLMYSGDSSVTVASPQK